MSKLFHSILLLFIISSCSGTTPSRTVNIIIYTNFINPKKTYEALNNEFLKSNLIDSLKVIGLPIFVGSYEILLDTVAIEQHNISLENLEVRLQKLRDSISGNVLSKQVITNESGKQIPLSAFAKIHLKSGYYKPEQFVPEPKVFYYQDKRAVKLELYCSKKNKKQLIEFIKNILPEYSKDFIEPQWQFEIVK